MEVNQTTAKYQITVKNITIEKQKKNKIKI